MSRGAARVVLITPGIREREVQIVVMISTLEVWLSGVPLV